MDQMIDKKSDIISINDILDELMSENKRLFNELLFANNCFNELKTHLINIHSKYETIIDCEDIRRWDQLNDKISDGLLSKELVSNDNCWQLLTKSTDGSDVRLKRLSIDRQTQEILSTIDGNNGDNEVNLQYLCPHKDCNMNFNRKYDLMIHSVIHRKHLPKSSRKRHQLTQKRRQTIKDIQYVNESNEDTDVEPRHRCPHKACGKTFVKMADMASHSQTHQNVLKTFKCHHKDCPFESQLKKKLNEHLKRHSSGRPFVCPQIGCQKTFKSKCNLNTHSANHMTGEVFKCMCKFIACNDMFNTEYERQLHHRFVHNNPNTNVCNVDDVTPEFNEDSDQNSNKSLVTESESQKPMQTSFDLLIKSHCERDKCYDLNQKVFICPINECYKKWEIDPAFLRHLNGLHSAQQFRYEFKGCDKAFRSRYHLSLHSNKHRDDKPFKCHYNGCKFQTHLSKSLRNHLTNTHSTEQTMFACDVIGCQKILKTANNLKYHKVTHISQPTIRCGMNGCNELFFTDYKRRKHQTEVHNRVPQPVHKGRAHPCDWPGCDWSGKGLSGHKRVHTGEKKLACDWPECDKRFRTKRALDDHMNVHNNVKPYACHWPGCQYTTASHSNIFKHTKQVHKT